jgi:hypothetical protein
MPPRHYLVDVLPTLLPESPFLLAVQTVMSLAPHPLDPNPRSPRSKRLRSSASAALGRKAMDAIQRIMASGTPSVEAIQALTLLAVWEWGSTNNAMAAMDLFRQGVQLAISMGMHDMDAGGTGFALEGIDWRRDMMRRTWWILYVYQLTSGLVSGLQPPLGADDPSIKVDFPICSDKDRTWSTWINCIRQCFRVVNMINVLAMDGQQGEGGMKAWGSAGEAPELSPEQQELKRRQMIAIDRQIMELMKQTEKMSVVEQVPGGEEDVVRNQQIATRFGLAGELSSSDAAHTSHPHPPAPHDGVPRGVAVLETHLRLEGDERRRGERGGVVRRHVDTSEHPAERQLLADVVHPRAAAAGAQPAQHARRLAHGARQLWHGQLDRARVRQL